MFKEEEEKLALYKNELDNIAISLDSLDNAIMAGFKKAKTENRKRIRKMRGIYSFVTAALILIGLFSSIKISSAFASYISEIPGMEKIVERIRNDKGRMAAVENNYYQQINASDEKDGLKVTVDGVIADEKQMLFFYTLNSKEKLKEIEIDKINLRAKDGTRLYEAGITYGKHNSEEGEKSFNGEFEFMFEAPLTVKEYVIDVETKGKKFSIPFTLKDFKGKKEYAVNKTMELEGQKINVEKIIVYPLSVAVQLENDPSNTKQILALEDLHLEDENGEVWGGINNGVVSTGSYDEKQEFYLQSNYFHQPKKLYLVLNKAQAVEKDELNLIVDTKKLAILKQPKNNLLSNMRIEGNDLVFDLAEKKEFGFIFGTITDANGKEIQSHSQNSGFDFNKGINILGLDISQFGSYKNPITIKLSHYPSWIHGESKIRIK
jgi:hypothetical protein